ncbi:MAG: 4-hydroxy-3-methylbut-2-enyl diphosphate reductase [Streptosporangiales bacterium]|nr:4-hydroxy-3-methylbut-2-enyl diphosphate reductase [Streptosporangiales bacterium]
MLLAAPRSFCAGVERAIDIVERALDIYGAPVYVRKQIVHNASVVAQLAAAGAVFVEELDEVPQGSTVVFSAHGVSPEVRAEAERRSLEVVDATCPLVAKVHQEARRIARRGGTVVLIGHAGHEEVEGTLGEAPERTVLVQDRAEAERLPPPDTDDVTYVVQTTLSQDDVTDLVDALRRRVPHLADPPSDDICYATTNRQQALRAVAASAELVLVVGSANSSNGNRLVEVARRSGVAAHLVDGPDDVDPQWLAGVRTVGISAAASTPPELVDAVVAAIGGLGPVEVTERRTTTEDIHFTLPREVRNA